MSAAELHKVSVIHASSIVILADQSDPDLSDARTLRTVLCLMGLKAMGEWVSGGADMEPICSSPLNHQNPEPCLLPVHLPSELCATGQSIMPTSFVFNSTGAKGGKPTGLKVRGFVEFTCLQSDMSLS